eukprot:m.99682 g.99682  ORF g.99682 m.99682 type:complete len:193 (+) comp13149_c0_seq3:1530-2108(+)
MDNWFVCTLSSDVRTHFSAFQEVYCSFFGLLRCTVVFIFTQCFKQFTCVLQRLVCVCVYVRVCLGAEGKLLDTAGPLLRFTVQNHDPSKPRIDAFQVNCRANVQPSIESAIDAVEESVEEGVSATCPTSTLTAGSDDGCAVGDVQTIPVSPLNPATLLSTLQPQPLILVLGHLGPSTLDALPDIHLASLSLL